MHKRNVLDILGKNMHDIRFAKNMTLQEVAEKTKIDIKTLKKFEAGEYSGLKIPQYIKIATALGVSYESMTKGIEFTED